jgi:molecular chaperone DnaK (HSP70)
VKEKQLKRRWNKKIKKISKIINVPTVTEISYSFQNLAKDESIILVFDLCRGIFDFSIVKIIEYLDSCGNNH